MVDDDEAVSTDEDTLITGNTLNSAQNSDLAVTGFEVNGVTYAVGSTASLVEGELTLNSDGSYTFLPSDNYNGDVPVATYTVENSAGDRDISTLSIVVEPVIDLADDEEIVSNNEDTTITGDVLINASSPDDPLSVTGFEVGGETYEIGDTANLEEGDLTLNEDGSYTFVPTENYNGPVPVATYTVLDGAGDQVTSTLTIVIDPVSDLIDEDEVVSIEEDTTLTGNVLNNASSPDNPLSINGFEIGGETYNIGDTAILEEGELTINSDGSYTFVPADDYHGDVPVATYIVEDGAGDTDISTLIITVNPVSDLTDGDEVVRINENTSAIGNVLNNASTPDNPLSVTDFTVGGIQYAIGSTAQLTEGNLTINANGSYVFVPNNDYVGVVPVATYTVTDGAGDTDLSSLRITVNGVGNIPPVAADDSFSVDQGESVSGNVITHNDGDGVVDTDGGDGATLTVTHVNGTPLVFDANGDAIVTVEGGELTINAQGQFTYQNSEGFALGSTPPSFEYTLFDGTDNDTASVTIIVNDTAPVANDDYNFISTKDSTAGNVITRATSGDASDTSSDGVISLVKVAYDGIEYSFGNDSVITINTDIGFLTIDNTGQYKFTRTEESPASLVTEVFTYTIQDGDVNNPEQDSANLTIEVRPSSNRPATSENVDDDNLDIYLSAVVCPENFQNNHG